MTIVIALLIAFVTLAALCPSPETNPARASCGCKRCWYVNDPPETAPMCPRVVFMATVGVAAIAFWALARRKR